MSSLKPFLNARSGPKEKLNHSCIDPCYFNLSLKLVSVSREPNSHTDVFSHCVFKTDLRHEFSQFSLDLKLYHALHSLPYPLFLTLSSSQKHSHVPAPLSSAWIFPRQLEDSSNYLQLYFSILRCLKYSGLIFSGAVQPQS